MTHAGFLRPNSNFGSWVGIKCKLIIYRGLGRGKYSRATALKVDNNMLHDEIWFNARHIREKGSFGVYKPAHEAILYSLVNHCS